MTVTVITVNLKKAALVKSPKKSQRANSKMKYDSEYQAGEKKQIT